jgi:hypothetical protein
MHRFLLIFLKLGKNYTFELDNKKRKKKTFIQKVEIPV